MAEELGNLELFRTDFINTFSHEFKTPIVSIRGYAKLLKRPDLTEEERCTAALALTSALPERAFTGAYDRMFGPDASEETETVSFHDSSIKSLSNHLPGE